MNRAATISDCGQYRYMLTRSWSTEGRTCVFVMLNPSTADAEVDDPTIRRCIGFAQREGCGRLLVLNLFAYRATDPKAMKAASNAEGDPRNLLELQAIATTDALIIAAWGQHGKHRGRSGKVSWALRGVPLWALEVNKDGSPKHPLYVKGDAALVPFNDKAKSATYSA